MYDLLGPVLIIGFFSSINLMLVHNPAKFPQYSVIFAKSAANAKIHLFFHFFARAFIRGHCRYQPALRVFMWVSIYKLTNTELI
jgi:hypothetical protein